MLSLINTDLAIKKLSKDLVHFTNTSKFDYRSHRQWHLKVEKSRIQKKKQILQPSVVVT